MSTLALLTPVTLGQYRLPNRLVMAPLTRLRAGSGLVPQAMAATYYGQRASAGLIISEATDIAIDAQGYANAPGIYSKEQIAGWQQVTSAVHARGGKMFSQLWHCGRMSHPSMLDGQLPVAPSAICPGGEAVTYQGLQARVVPRALELNEIPGIVDRFKHAATCAKEAGFDGIELHSANGYLLDQFLRDGSNQRTDRYGGSFANRTRLLEEVLTAVLSIWGAGRVGVRLSPSGTVHGMTDSNPAALFAHVAGVLNQLPLAYIHIIEKRQDSPADFEPPPGLSTADLRRHYHGTIISAGGYDRQSGEHAIASGAADLIAFGRLFISNPDLPERFAANADLTPYDRTTFYTGGERGYIDYPTLESLKAEV